MKPVMTLGPTLGLTLGRRDLLRAGAVLLPLAGAVACTGEPDEPPPPDPLAAMATRARSDAAAASAVAAAVAPLAAAAKEVAAARGEHATTLQREVDRARPPASSSKQAPPSQAPAPGGAPAARKSLLDALTAAEQEAAKLVPSVERYRAGLVGSVAAGCASLREVFV